MAFGLGVCCLTFSRVISISLTALRLKSATRSGFDRLEKKVTQCHLFWGA